jgi:DDE superfamily endonuclease
MRMGAGLPLAPGHVERRDYEYERHGTANLFVMVEPLAGWRHVAVTAHCTKQDDAEVLRCLVEERSPEAECICVVQDNLNMHTASPHCASPLGAILDYRRESGNSAESHC